MYGLLNFYNEVGCQMTLKYFNNHYSFYQIGGCLLLLSELSIDTVVVYVWLNLLTVWSLNQWGCWRGIITQITLTLIFSFPYQWSCFALWIWNIFCSIYTLLNTFIYIASFIFLSMVHLIFPFSVAQGTQY